MPALDVTLMIVPDPRSRMWGEMARLTAITPKVICLEDLSDHLVGRYLVRPKQADTRVIYESIDFSKSIYPLRNSIGNALRLRDVEGRDQQLIAVVEQL
jgi:hypothetical protein